MKSRQGLRRQENCDSRHGYQNPKQSIWKALSIRIHTYIYIYTYKYLKKYIYNYSKLYVQNVYSNIICNSQNLKGDMSIKNRRHKQLSKFKQWYMIQQKKMTIIWITLINKIVLHNSIWYLIQFTHSSKIKQINQRHRNPMFYPQRSWTG